MNVIETQATGPRWAPGNSVLVFALAGLVFFCGMSLLPNEYDEGLVLTASMRVAAGQVPHRDFFADYGPAQYYLLAGLFRLFGESVLVERLLDLFFKSLSVASVYAIAACYLGRQTAAWVSMAALTYIFGALSHMCSYPTTAASLFALLSTALLVPAFARSVSRRRLFAAGATAGLAALFRYDTGLALLGVQACILVIGICVRCKGNRLRALAAAYWPTLAGFATVMVAPALYFLSAGSLPALKQDVLFVAHNYFRGRNIPFPAIDRMQLHNFAVYLPIVVAGLSVYALRNGFSTKQHCAERKYSRDEWRGFLVAFSLLAIALYFKGLVRPSVLGMYPSIILSLLLAGALFHRRFCFPRGMQFAIVSVIWLFFIAAGWSALQQFSVMYVMHSSLAEHLWSSARGTTSPIRATWCRTRSVATRGLCFLPEDDRIQAIEFISSHTRPDQTLFVGLPRHDRIWGNDNFTYFASQRLPATRWSQYEPDLQDSYDIQRQMIHELEETTPPYVVLDSEFEGHQPEPNDSSRSTGVTVLDEYIRKTYRHTQSYGTMSIWQRIPSG